MNGLVRRIVITLAILALPFILGLLITYQVIHIEWVSFMEIQPSYRPMEAPLPLPAGSVPLEGAAYVPGAGDPLNPVAADAQSLSRGKAFFGTYCALCHGSNGQGDGPIAEKLTHKPPAFNNPNVSELSDGEIFLVITNGVRPGVGVVGGMPPLKENLGVADRWDVVNYIRSLQKR